MVCLGALVLNTVQKKFSLSLRGRGKQRLQSFQYLTRAIKLRILDYLHLVTAFLWVASSIGPKLRLSLIKRRCCRANQTGKLQQRRINEHGGLSGRSLINMAKPICPSYNHSENYLGLLSGGPTG